MFDELGRELDDVAKPVALAVLARELARERRDVCLAFAQRGHDELDYIEPIVEVLAELPRLDCRGEIAVGRCDDAHIDLLHLRRADRLDLALLQDTQQLGLER
jgi:hypothetical protein